MSGWEVWEGEEEEVRKGEQGRNGSARGEIKDGIGQKKMIGTGEWKTLVKDGVY